MRSRQQFIDVQVTQGALNYARRSNTASLNPFFATVTAVYPDRMTCDLQSVDGGPFTNIPVLTRAGLVDGAPYGEFWLPAIDDTVLVFPAGGDQLLVVIGTVIPYLVNEYNADAVNSASKQFTKALLEEGTENHYKRVFKNGVSVETKEDGTIIVETPSGVYVKFDETAAELTLSDPHGNVTTYAAAGTTITDANGNTVSMESGKVVINGNLEVLQ